MNPIIQNLQSRNQQMPANNIRSMYRAYKNTPNPKALVQQILSANPMLAQIIQGGNLKDQFYSLCAQKGVDPDQILNQLK